MRPSRIIGRSVKYLLVGFVGFHAALVVFIFFACLVLLWWNPPRTALMTYRQTTVHQKPRPLQFVPLKKIPRNLQWMMIRLEDYRFYEHPGIDLGAIHDAYMINKANKGKYTLYGGSTIPQQLARNLFLTPRKTYTRKYIEAIIAVEMSALLPKGRILELYLNCIEWGKGVYGIGAASSYYYGARVWNLSIDQMRRLVVIITNPLRYNVETFSRSNQMAERYRYLVSRFPTAAETSAQEALAEGIGSDAPPPASTSDEQPQPAEQPSAQASDAASPPTAAEPGPAAPTPDTSTATAPASP